MNKVRTEKGRARGVTARGQCNAIILYLDICLLSCF